MLKIGTKIRIRKDLSEKDNYSSSYGVNDEMASLRGEWATITDVYEDVYEEKHGTNPARRCRYFLDIDGGDWTWGIDMFETGKKEIEIE